MGSVKSPKSKLLSERRVSTAGPRDSGTDAPRGPELDVGTGVGAGVGAGVGTGVGKVWDNAWMGVWRPRQEAEGIGTLWDICGRTGNV